MDKNDTTSANQRCEMGLSWGKWYFFLILFILESAIRKLHFTKVGHNLVSLIAKCSKLANVGS